MRTQLIASNLTGTQVTMTTMNYRLDQTETLQLSKSIYTVQNMNIYISYLTTKPKTKRKTYNIKT